MTACSQEQFGGAIKSETAQTDPLKNFQQVSCSNRTLIKPKVDILYIVDNSLSTYAIQSDIKNAVANTVSLVSQEFDYRLVGTPLINSSNDNTKFKVLTNSEDSLGTNSSKKIISPSEFGFFDYPASGSNEYGFQRVADFITYHSSSSVQENRLFRQGAYLLVVLISNGRDTSVEYSYAGNSNYYNSTAYLNHKTSLINLKNQLNSQEFRFMSVVTHATPVCNQSGWLAATKSYVQMSKDIFFANNPTAQEQSSNPSNDSYNLCASGLSTIFNAVNDSIKQVVVPHKYKYWPIEFDNFDSSKLKVFKTSGASSPVEMTSGWTYKPNPDGTSINTRISPLPEGEPTTSKHLIEFSSGNEVTYPDCISITSTTNLEFFQYIVLPVPPVESSIVVRIRGQEISKSTTNGWQYTAYQQVPNIKVPHTYNGQYYSDQPATPRSGYMIKLNGDNNYYKTGDSVEIYYTPAPL